ncbi:GNAT family N-acetyltransferase [Holzapfeliella sp. He02]|uniref:GNAT family N-acetyltransferase n=1 Tax=Holzapfeliella saturejae TaxID=3082953 RepID=A0ABU8SHS9_9LACO
MIVFKQTNKIDVDKLDQLYSSVGWSSYTANLNQLAKAVNNSRTVISAWDYDQLVGLIRAVGDGETILYIQDLLVKPNYQNQKIGSNLLEKMLTENQHIRQKVLLAEDTQILRNFYNKHGYEPCEAGNVVSFYREFSANTSQSKSNFYLELLFFLKKLENN